MHCTGLDSLIKYSAGDEIVRDLARIVQESAKLVLVLVTHTLCAGLLQ